MTNLSSGRLQVSNMIYEDSKSVVIVKQKLLIFKLYLKERIGEGEEIHNWSHAHQVRPG